MNKFESSLVVSAFRDAIHAVSDPLQAHYICGVSGGVDSMTLLFLMHRSGISVTVAHCNYRLRGAASDADRDLVEQVSAMWGFDCITATFDPSEAKNQNTQAWAREKRYRVFRDLKTETGAGFIVTGHHQTDQVETILQRILRGSGLQSWKGMELRQQDLLRPLLKVTKDQIRAFANEHHIPYREDETNKSVAYARNFLRHKLAPDMDQFFPGWRANVLTIPQRAEEFSAMADLLLDQVLQDDRLKRNKLLALPALLRPVIMHRFLKKFLPEVVISKGVLERFEELNHLQTGAQIEIDSARAVIRDRDYFVLVNQRDGGKEKEFSFSREDLANEKNVADFTLKIIDWKGRIDARKLQMDAAKIQWPVTVRQWRQGDRVQCLGMEGRKSVADLLTDKKIAVFQKGNAFLIESFDGIVCAVIFPLKTAGGQDGVISEKVKCGPETKQILQIEKDT